MESPEHLLLKHLAVQWALEEGYRAVGTEVRLPNSSFRADVAACRVNRPRPGVLEIDRTVAFECKQSRADFLADSFPEKDSSERLRILHERKEKLQKLVGAHYPTLRAGDSLFPEFESSDPTVIRHEGYRMITSEITKIEKGLSGRTKFDRLLRYRCADLCFLVIRRGILEAHEIPEGWGVLAYDFDDESDQGLEMIQKPRWNNSSDTQRLDFLHRLACQNIPKLVEMDQNKD